MTEERWNSEEAAAIVQLAYEPDTKRPMFIAVLDGGERVAHELDKYLARELAVRLVELAAELPEPPRILRRASEVDDILRDLEP